MKFVNITFLSFGLSDWPDFFFVTTGASLDDFMHKVGLFNWPQEIKF